MKNVFHFYVYIYVHIKVEQINIYFWKWRQFSCRYFSSNFQFHGTTNLQESSTASRIFLTRKWYNPIAQENCTCWFLRHYLRPFLVPQNYAWKLAFLGNFKQGFWPFRSHLSCPIHIHIYIYIYTKIGVIMSGTRTVCSTSFVPVMKILCEINFCLIFLII